MNWETIIGLEVHVELATASKIFCGCATDFGRPPNTQCCPVCSGLPGALPVLNRQVVEYALRACLATGCEISRLTRFDRKNYFYPDLPKAYQISQLHQPIGRNGQLTIATETGDKVIRIREIHMEEDAGKLMHDPWEDCTQVDYNRCGVPLLEIVSQPDLRSPKEALAYLEKLRSILMFLGVSDCRMQEGSFRADVNVSVRPARSDALGIRTEMKNMNSTKAIGRAIAFESRRQIEILTKGGTIRQETRRWDDNKDASLAMRSKEDAQDYRYFPDPDLVAVRIDEAWIDRVRATQPELPESRRQRYQAESGLSPYEASVLTADPALAGLFEAAAVICGRPKDVAGWIMGELLQACKERECEPQDLDLPPERLARIVELVDEGRITRGTARQVFVQIIDHQVDPDGFITGHNLAMVRDTGALNDAIDRAIAENPQSVADYRAGKTKAMGYLVGQVMRATRGKADPGLLNRLLIKKLEASN